MLKRPNNPTYQLFIAVLSIYWRTIARHQFSDELKIFCWKLIFVVHKLYVLFPNTSFNGWWHFHDTQFCISYKKNKITMYKIYQSQWMLTDHIQAWTEHMMLIWHWPCSVCDLLRHDTMLICRCINDISKAAWCLNHQNQCKVRVWSGHISRLHRRWLDLHKQKRLSVWSKPIRMADSEL